MSEKLKNGGPAFPSGEKYRNGAGNLCGKNSLYEGMTLRDYFAAKAMQGFLTQDDIIFSGKSMAQCAYEMADAMLEARGQG